MPASPQALDTLRPILADPELSKIGHNLKFDLAVLNQNNCPVRGTCLDTLLAHSLLDPTQRHNLDSLAENRLGYTPIRFDDLIPGQKKDSDIDYTGVDPQALSDYAIEDADIALQLWQHLKPQIESTGLTRVFYEIETPLLPVLVHIEQQGIALSTETLSQIGSELETHIETLRESVYQAAGHPFNLNSPKQLGEVLFDELQLVEKPKKTRTGQYATNEQVLTTLANSHPIVAQILEYRQLSKLKSTYVDARSRRPRHPTRTHTLRPNPDCHRTPLLQRPQPPEHPRPQRARPANPQSLHPSQRLATPRRRLLSNRAPHPRRPQSGSRTPRSLPHRARHPYRHRRTPLRYPPRASRPRSAQHR